MQMVHQNLMGVALVLALLVISIGLAQGSFYSGVAAPTATKQMETVALDTRDDTLTVEPGQEFAVALESNPTSGFEWSQVHDEDMLQLVDHAYVQEEPEEGMVGVKGMEYFVFRALEPGNTEIGLTYSRPWEDEDAEQEKRTLQVKIR